MRKGRDEDIEENEGEGGGMEERKRVKANRESRQVHSKSKK